MVLSSFLGVNGDIFALGGQAANKCEYFSPQGREKYSHLFFGWSSSRLTALARLLLSGV
jgi:hypothetical protein